MLSDNLLEETYRSCLFRKRIQNFRICEGELQNETYSKELLGCDLGMPEGIDYAKTHNLFTEFCPAMVVSATKIAEQLMNR